MLGPTHPEELLGRLVCAHLSQAGHQHEPSVPRWQNAEAFLHLLPLGAIDLLSDLNIELTMQV